MDKTSFNGSKHFVLHSIAEGVFAAVASDGGAAISNSGLIDLGEQITVFDTFLTPQAALDLRQFSIERFGRRPHIVINSHYHNDHIWGNQVFAPEAQIISSTRTRQLIATAGLEELQWYSSNSSQQLEALRNQPPDADDEQGQKKRLLWTGYYEGLVVALPELRVCMPGITFDHHLEVHGTKHSAELIEYEGAHTGSDTVLYLPHAGIVFMCDLLFVGAHPYLADGDPNQLLKALRELSRLGAACFVPGHGPTGTIEDVKVLIAYVEHCMETAQRLVDGGEVDEEKIMQRKVPEQYRSWQLSGFYQANLRFLCERLKPASGDRLENENVP